MPWPPPDVPSSALPRCGSGRLSIRPAGADWTEPVTSLCGLLEPKPSLKRPESALQLATPMPINEMATRCGQLADRRDAHMVTHSNAILREVNKHRCGKQGFKCRGNLCEI